MIWFKNKCLNNDTVKKFANLKIIGKHITANERKETNINKHKIICI